MHTSGNWSQYRVIKFFFFFLNRLFLIDCSFDQCCIVRYFNWLWIACLQSFILKSEIARCVASFRRKACENNTSLYHAPSRKVMQTYKVPSQVFPLMVSSDWAARPLEIFPQDVNKKTIQHLSCSAKDNSREKYLRREFHKCLFLLSELTFSLGPCDHCHQGRKCLEIPNVIAVTRKRGEGKSSNGDIFSNDNPLTGEFISLYRDFLLLNIAFSMMRTEKRRLHEHWWKSLDSRWGSKCYLHA